MLPITYVKIKYNNNIFYQGTKNMKVQVVLLRTGIADFILKTLWHKF